MINEIVLGDCLEVLPKIESESIGLIFSDPPFMVSSDVVIYEGRKRNAKPIVHDFGQWDHFESMDKYLEWCYLWLDECVRVLKPGRLLCLYFDKDKIGFVSKYLQDHHGFKFKDLYADIKSNPVPQMRKVGWMSAWEVIGMWQKPGDLCYHWELGQACNYNMRAIVGYHTKEDGERCHPCQKPISVAKKFILYWSDPKDIILDPFCGSGTTCKAANLAGRRFIGIEKEKEYWEAARRRVLQQN